MQPGVETFVSSCIRTEWLMGFMRISPVEHPVYIDICCSNKRLNHRNLIVPLLLRSRVTNVRFLLAEKNLKVT